MAKRASLFGTASEASKASLPPLPVEVIPSNTAGPKRPASRTGKKIVSVFVAPEASKQLKLLALKGDSTVQALMVEALNDLFAKHGANRIAQ